MGFSIKLNPMKSLDDGDGNDRSNESERNNGAMVHQSLALKLQPSSTDNDNDNQR